MIELQLKLLSDQRRNSAFYEALREAIHPGESVVADIGSGTGFLSFMASKLGAKECYLYEYDDELVALSKRLSALNRVRGVHFVARHTSSVKRPVKVDIVVSETLGNYALEENIIENLEDARRFLKKNLFAPLLLTMLMTTPAVPTVMSCEPVETWMFSKVVGT